MRFCVHVHVKLLIIHVTPLLEFLSPFTLSLSLSLASDIILPVAYVICHFCTIESNQSIIMYGVNLHVLVLIGTSQSFFSVCMWVCVCIM